MRVLLALIVLLLIPAVAEAQPVCGASTKTHTLASNAEARVYKSSTRVYGCSRGHKPLALGTRVTKQHLTGHFAAVVHAGALTLSDLATRHVVGDRELNTWRVTAIALTTAGTAAWIETRGGVHEIHQLDRKVIASGHGIDPRFLHANGDWVSFRDGPYLMLGWYRHEERPGAQDTTTGSLGGIGDVQLTLARDPRGSMVLGARYQDGPWVTLGAPLSDPLPTGGEGFRDGYDALRVNGAFVAARDNGYDFQDGLHAAVTVFDLTGATAPRTLCQSQVVGDFSLSAQGEVTCAATASG